MNRMCKKVKETEMEGETRKVNKEERKGEEEKRKTRRERGEWHSSIRRWMEK